METAKHRGLNIVETAETTPSLTIFYRMLKAAGLDRTLVESGPFTVFAPTDDAFAKMPKGMLDRLLMPGHRAELAEILKGHVTSGTDMSSAVKLIELPSVAGPALRVRLDSSGVTINESRVTHADIACSNGVIHAIDQVVLPNGD
jgi:uncharacterized surface protein with fasciclin (FAS1) repeats